MALFRHQATQFQQHHLQWGDVSALQSPSTKWMSWLLICAVAVSVAFLVIAQYARKEVAIGYLTPTKGTAKIFVPRRGIIREVHVREGELVAANRPILTIQTEQIAGDGSNINSELLHTLTSQSDALEAQIEGEKQRIDLERDRLASLTRGIENELAPLQLQSKLQNERLKLSRIDVDGAQQLQSKGFLTSAELRKRQLAVLELQQLLSGLDQQIAAKQAQLSDAHSSLVQLPTVMAQKIQSMRNDLANAQQRIAEIKGRGAYVIRAPTTGRVTTLQAREGQNADPQRLQLEIIPADSVLQAELLVPSRAIGFVEPGQEVRILYDAFPYQHFGTHRARISEVSQTILTSSDAGGPIKLTEPAYRVIAALEQPTIHAYGKTIPLQPDMLLKADIILERRSLFSWLTGPLQSIRM